MSGASIASWTKQIPCERFLDQFLSENLRSLNLAMRAFRAQPWGRVQQQFMIGSALRGRRRDPEVAKRGVVWGNPETRLLAEILGKGESP